MKLSHEFYKRDTVEVAKELLGSLLVREFDGAILTGMIVETEAYLGKIDLGCHASKGKTKRNQSMFLSGGHAYVYLIYGMYHMLNFVTKDVDQPEAVLIRAVEPIDGFDVIRANRNNVKKDIDLTNGPGKLTKAYGITNELDGHCLSKSPLYVESYKSFSDKEITHSKRIGIDYAGEWKDKLLRFYIKDNKYVSVKDKIS